MARVTDELPFMYYPSTDACWSQNNNNIVVAEPDLTKQRIQQNQKHRT